MDALPPTPPTPRFTPRNLPHISPSPTSSPLNPTQPHDILAHRRPSANSFHHRKPFPPTPDSAPRLTPRTPLSFLANSPSIGSNFSRISSASSLGWRLLTPPQSPQFTGLPSPSPHQLPPANLNLAKTSNSFDGPLNVKIRSSRSSEMSTDGGSDSSDNQRHIPSPLDKLNYLQSIPASPPIVVPSAQLLEMPPNTIPAAASQHSIASPFVNLNSSPSPRGAKPGPLSSISPLVNARRQLANRRGSGLAHEMNRLELDNVGDDTGYDADASLDDESNGPPQIPPPNQSTLTTKQ